MGMESMPTGPKKVDDVEKAHEMAKAGDLFETKRAEEAKQNNGEEFSRFLNLEHAADLEENVAGAKYELNNKVKGMSQEELVQEYNRLSDAYDKLVREWSDIQFPGDIPEYRKEKYMLGSLLQIAAQEIKSRADQRSQ